MNLRRTITNAGSLLKLDKLSFALYKCLLDLLLSIAITSEEGEYVFNDFIHMKQFLRACAQSPIKVNGCGSLVSLQLLKFLLERTDRIYFSHKQLKCLFDNSVCFARVRKWVFLLKPLSDSVHHSVYLIGHLENLLVKIFVLSLCKSQHIFLVVHFFFYDFEVMLT